MAPQRLTSELVDTAVADYRHITEWAADHYQRGMLTDDEGCREVSSAFYDAFWVLLKRNHLKFALNTANYEQCQKEFLLFLAGSDLSTPAHVPWLFDVKNKPEEASKEDQRLVFLLMEQLDVSPSFFKPIPDNVLKPNKTYCHSYNYCCIVSIPFDCIDDGGLLRDDNPVDKTFTLVNTLGLKAVLTIKEDRRKENYAGLDFDEMVYKTDRGIVAKKAEFLAEGSIEGYTTQERHGSQEILVRLKSPGKINSLAYSEYSEDYNAFSDYPLWQEYLAEQREQWRRDREHSIRLLRTPIKIE